MNKLIGSLSQLKTTENGALAYRTSGSGLLDLFSLGAAYRSRTDEDMIQLVSKAWDEGPENTLKTLFYIRDIRGGAGERRFFRVTMNYLLSRKKITNRMYVCMLIPEYGRFDDLVWIYGNTTDEDLRKGIARLLKHQFNIDFHEVDDKKLSLLGKWLPSITGSSFETVRIARMLRKDWGLTETAYRKKVSKLRKRLKVLEPIISRNAWSEVVYEHVPSQAMLKYRTAFSRHDSERFSEYCNSVTKGEKKVNTSTLYPYQLASQACRYRNDQSIDLLWNNLPNYINEKNKNALVVCDVSGSMLWTKLSSVTPLDVSTSLALYFAERNTGEFKDYFFTFSSRPTFVKIEGNTLSDKLLNIRNADWGGSTNLEAVFELLLTQAKRINATEEDMPSLLYVITDMEFDSNANWTTTTYQSIKQKYKDAGYKLPHIVFWNVNARNDTLPVTLNDLEVTLVSGLSPVIFGFAVEGKSPVEFMMSVIGSERYKAVTLNTP